MHDGRALKDDAYSGRDALEYSVNVVHSNHKEFIVGLTFRREDCRSACRNIHCEYEYLLSDPINHALS